MSQLEKTLGDLHDFEEVCEEAREMGGGASPEQMYLRFLCNIRITPDECFEIFYAIDFDEYKRFAESMGWW